MGETFPAESRDVHQEEKELTCDDVIHILRKALEDQDSNVVTDVLKRLGQNIAGLSEEGKQPLYRFQVCEKKGPTDNRYELYLGSGTSGQRIFVYKLDSKYYPNTIRFPAERISRMKSEKMKMSLEDAFLAFFGTYVNTTQAEGSERAFHEVSLKDDKVIEEITT